MAQRIQQAGQRRLTVPLGKSYSRIAALLDFESAFALGYAQAWASRAGGQKAAASIIVRRALALYAHHLETRTGPDLLTEWRAIQRAGAGNEVSSRCSNAPQEDLQDAALARLNTLADLEAGSPFPRFWVALHGAEVVAAQDSALADLDAAWAERLNL